MCSVVAKKYGHYQMHWAVTDARKIRKNKNSLLHWPTFRYPTTDNRHTPRLRQNDEFSILHISWISPSPLSVYLVRWPSMHMHTTKYKYLRRFCAAKNDSTKTFVVESKCQSKQTNSLPYSSSLAREHSTMFNHLSPHTSSLLYAESCPLNPYHRRLIRLKSPLTFKFVAWYDSRLPIIILQSFSDHFLIRQPTVMFAILKQKKNSKMCVDPTSHMQIVVFQCSSSRTAKKTVKNVLIVALIGGQINLFCRITTKLEFEKTKSKPK